MVLVNRWSFINEASENLQENLQESVTDQQDAGSNTENEIPQEHMLRGGRLSNLKDMDMKILLPTLLIQQRVLSQSLLHIEMPSLAKN